MGQDERGVPEFELARILDERDDRADVAPWMMFRFHETSSVLAHTREPFGVLQKRFEV